VAPDAPQAQPIQIADQVIVATAIDLLLAITKNGALLMDLRDDLNGKPASSSLLPNPVQFQIRGPIGLPSEGSGAVGASWMSVPLPAAFQLQTGRKYWLVLQSIEGEANWNVESTTGTDIALQRTPDGGLSWQLSTTSAFRGPVAALFRLRGKPEVFTMPIEIEIGSEDLARGLGPERVTLNRFDPSGRVDFTLDFDEVADGFNRFLDNAAPTLCPEGEHLVNGDFEKWLQVGDELMGPRTISLDVGPEALAVSPDGSKAYIAGETDSENGLLQIVDVICGTVNKQQDLELSNIPTLIVISPDGSRAFLLFDSDLQVIDLDAHQALGEPFSLEHSVIAALLSQDGGLLFFSAQVETTGGVDVMAVDTAGLEKFSHSGGPKPEITQPPNTLPLVSILSRGFPNQRFAVTPDVKSAVVLDESGTQITVVNTETGSDVTSIPISGSAVAIAISPDGSTAYVATQVPDVCVIDLKRGMPVREPIKVSESPLAVAVTPNRDRILLANDSTSSLSSIQIGSRQPYEWNLVSGQVMPYCLPEPHHLIALLGDRSFSRAGSKTEDNTIPSILSQMVPVAESCPYEIRFLGIASSDGATAEVRWLDQKGALIGSNPEQISIAPKEDGKLSSLSLHYRQLPAPKDATQAEIRFVVPMGVAAIDNVSFHATTEAVVNSDFSLREDDRLAGWSLSPGAARGISLLAIDSGIRLQNAGADTVELVQTIPAKGNQHFELQVDSAVLRAKTDGNPRVEIHWLKDSVPLADEIVLDIPMESFSALGANGTSPETATQAEIHLIVPPGATQELRRVSMTFTPTVRVPLAFVAQTSGELTASALRVALEKAVTPRPPIPDTGLFMPAPAQANGEAEPDEDGCFCACCKSTEAMINATTMKTVAERPVQVGSCTTCGDRIVRFGGPLIPNAPRFTLRNELAAKPVVLMRSRATLAGSQQEEIHAVAPPQPLTAIDRIGEARERRLVEAGIDSFAKLAATPAKRVMELLQPAVSEEMARKFIQDAARLVRGEQPSPPPPGG
jgi:DNA-binding beta-propeller fold protein YncE